MGSFKPRFLRDYEITTHRRAELLWYRADFSEAGDRTPVAYVMRMDRLVKSTSPLWQEQRQERPQA